MTKYETDALDVDVLRKTPLAFEALQTEAMPPEAITVNMFCTCQNLLFPLSLFCVWRFVAYVDSCVSAADGLFLFYQYSSISNTFYLPTEEKLQACDGGSVQFKPLRQSKNGHIKGRLSQLPKIRSCKLLIYIFIYFAKRGYIYSCPRPWCCG